MVAARGLLPLFTSTAYLPLMLHETHGWSVTAAGVPLIAGSLCWSLASAWQGRHPDLARPTLLRIGFAILAAGCLGGWCSRPRPWGVPWLATRSDHGLPATGMGLGLSAISTVLAPEPAGQGRVSTPRPRRSPTSSLWPPWSALGGALLVLLWTPAAALPVLLRWSPCSP